MADQWSEQLTTTIGKALKQMDSREKKRPMAIESKMKHNGKRS